MFRKRKLKKLYGVDYFYTDTQKRFEFYYRKNWLDQFDVMVFDIANKSNRWFMVTASIFYTFISLADNASLSVFDENIQKAPKPKVVNEYIHNHGYKLLSHKVTTFNAESVVIKMGEFGVEGDRQGVVLLKRIASIPQMDNMVLGMDTLELPLDGVLKLTDIIRSKYFKDVEITVDIEEEKNATN